MKDLNQRVHQLLGQKKINQKSASVIDFYWDELGRCSFLENSSIEMSVERAIEIYKQRLDSLLVRKIESVGLAEVLDVLGSRSGSVRIIKTDMKSKPVILFLSSGLDEIFGMTIIMT